MDAVQDLLVLVAVVRQLRPDWKVDISTLSDYFETLHRDPVASFTEASGVDFFPYIACSDAESKCPNLPWGAPDAYWTGLSLDLLMVDRRG